MKKVFESCFRYKLIYIFEVHDNAHKGLLKIGDTTVKTDCPAEKLLPNCKILNQAALARIHSYTNTAGVEPILLHTEIVMRVVDGKLKFFRDYDVHNVLKSSNVKMKPPKGTHGKEWFKVNLETARRAIQAVKQGSENLSGVNSKDKKFVPIILRPEQEDAVKLTVKRFKTGDRMLWNAKMRFGKTLTALELTRRMNFSKTIIITHRPVVDNQWYEDFDKIFPPNGDYLYGSKNKGKNFEDLLTSGKNFVYFASMQDLRGSEKVGGNFSKNAAVFNTDWDFVIVDEAHEGTQTARGDSVIQNILKENTKFLALSGTPFNILGDYDENIYTWDYVMEQRAKANWDKENFGDSNPYEELPKMNIFTYNLRNILKNSAYVELADKAFNFREFFRTNQDGNFVHEADVKSFLNLLVKQGNSNYPYSNEEYRKLFRHSLWIIPGVKEGRALSKLLKAHPVFGNFEIVNVAGNGDEDEESSDALDKVQKAIDKHYYTITLSCGKLTTGVTVPEWTAVFMLAGGSSTSAMSYLQTIFRVQSPCNLDGEMKENCYVFDFAPDRTLKIIAESASISAKAGNTNDNDRFILGEFLNYCPIIAVDGSQMKTYDAVKFFKQLKRAHAERAVRHGFDDLSLYISVELWQMNDVDFDNLKILTKIFGASKSQKKNIEIEINAQGFTKEEYEKIRRAEKKSSDNLTPEEKALIDKLKKQRRQRANVIATLRNVSIRMPLLIYGADIPLDEDFTIEMFLDDKIVDPESWEEFMPKGFKKEIFKDFMKFYDPEVFVEAGHKIRTLAKNADELIPTRRVIEIAKLFNTFKNPDKETVLTPFRVVNLHMSESLGGWNFFDELHEFISDAPRFVDNGKITADTLTNLHSKILEINSKTGLYPLYVAYSIYRARLGDRDENSLPLDELQKIWDETVSENIFVICKTPMAKTITQRTLAGFRNASVNARYIESLVEKLKFEPDNVLASIKHKSNWRKGVGLMKFDAVVGNPPYQISNDDGNFAAPIYHEFLRTAFKISDKVSLIHPARFLFNAGATPKTFNAEILNNKRFKILKYFPDSRKIFPTADIKGGVAISLFDANENFGKIDTFTAFEELNSILHKVTSHENFSPFSEIVYSRTIHKLTDQVHQDFPSAKNNLSDGHLYDMSTNIFDLLPEIFFDTEPNDEHEYIKILGRQFGERILKFIRRDYVNNPKPLEKWKIFVPDANGSGAIGEVISTPLVGSPLVGSPLVGCTETFITVGAFDTRAEAEACIAYIKTKFCRALLGVLKVTQHNPPQTWAKVPLQDFTPSSDIDWSKSIHEIDKQLYAKYKLTPEEISFIESKVTGMDR